MTSKQSFNLIQCPLQGTNLIEASAGTGKTYTICSLYARLVIEKERHVSNILVVTFTEAATEELRDRIRKVLYEMHVLYTRRLTDDNYSLESYHPWMIDMLEQCPPTTRRVQNLEMAIRNFDEAAIYTIHAFCHRILQENAFESGVIFDAELLSDTSHLIQEVSDDFFRWHFYEASPLFLQFAKITNHTPDIIREWINYIITVPFVTIAPDTVCPSEQDIQNLENEYELHFVRAKEMFNRHYQDIEDMLCFNNKRLNQIKYKIDNIPKYMNQLGAFFSDAPVLRLPGELLYKFQTRKIIEGTNKNQTPPMHPFFDACESVIDTYSNLEKLYENKMAYIKKEYMQKAQSQLIEKKKKLQIQSFDDLLHYVYNALKNDIENRLAHSLRKQYQAALIDEFQDTDPLQYQIFYRIFNDSQCALYIIGDPKQAIYSFRGADLFAYLKGVKQTDCQYTLDTNWRSNPLLVNAINTIFMQNPNAFVYGDIAFQGVTSALPQIQLYLGKDQAPQTPLQLMYINNPDTGKKQLSKEKAREIIYKQVGDHINTLLNLARNNQALLNDRALQAGDIAILVRKNYEARHIQMALHERGIPGVVYSQERVWESRICMDIAHVMAAVADYQNEQHLKSALTSALIGMNADTLIETTGDSNLWDEWIQRFQHYHEIWRKKGFMIMFRLLLARENVRARILSMPDGERLLTDLLHIAELLHQVDMEKKPGMSGLLEYFNRYRAGEQYTKHESHIRLETDENAVKIVTIHKSKGLQYNIVYCPFLWDGAKIKTKKPFVFHDPDNNHTLTLPITQEARESCKKRAQMEYLAENMRLFYVALTRARYHCFLVHGDINESSSSPLSWLLHGKPCIQNNRVPNTIVDQLNTLIGKMSSTAIEDALNNLARDSQETIQVSFDSWVLPEIDTAKSPVLKDRQTVINDLSCLQLNQTIDSNWRVTSFSALTSNKTHASEIPDHDTFTKDIGILEEKQPKPGTIFAFPKGARPGTFMHELLELVDFEKADTTQIGLLVNEKLTEYGFDPKWQDTIAALIHRVRNAQLSTNDPDFRFCHIPAAHGINELGFYFPINDIQANSIKGIIENVPWVKRARTTLYPLDTFQIKGMMKGFVDLIFSYKNKYYIVDWKSNYLGPELKYYNQTSMKHAILEHYYILQYYIYTIALHRYLGYRVASYSYETHFGGVYYIFLRGLDDRHSGKYGIFWDRPAQETVMALNRFFQEGPDFFFKQSGFLTQKSFDF